MPAIEFLTHPDFSTASPVAAGAAGSQAVSGSAPPGSQFGDVLSHSIDSTSASGPHSGNGQPGDLQSGNAQSVSRQPARLQSENEPSGPVKPLDGNAPAVDDAQKPPQQNADPAAAPPAGNGAATDQQSLLAASLSGANHAPVAQSPPANSTGASSSKGDKPAVQPVAVPGAAPAQLVSNLSQADAATGGTTSASTTGAPSASGPHSGNGQPEDLRSGNAQSGSPQSANETPGTVKPSDGNAPSAGDAQKPSEQNADPAAAQPAGNGAATDQQSLLAASLSGANHALSEQSSPSNSAGVSNSKAGKPAQNPATLAGAAPAQLVTSLLQADIANGNTPGASTRSATQAAQNKFGQTSGDVNAPQALIAGLRQAANLTDAQSNRASPGQSAPATPASDARQNTTPAADKGAAPPAAQRAPTPAASAAATADTGNLVSLIQTSTTLSTEGTAGLSSGGNSSGKNPTIAGAAGDVSSAPQVALPATTTANGSGNSQMSPQSDSNSSSGSSSGAPGGQPGGGLQPGAVTLVGNIFAENGARQSAALQAAPADSSPAMAQVSTTVLPSTPATSTTSALDKSNPAQPANTNDASQAAQHQGSPTPGYLLFGAAPPSLQLHATSFTAAQTASSGSLSSLVLDQVAYAVQYSHSNGQQMQLHLNPPELGALQIDVSMRDGMLSARIEAQTSTAQQILTDNIAQLKDSLTQQGVSFDRIDVHLAGSNTGSGGSSTADKSFAQQHRQQQDGALAWDQQFAQPEIENSAQRIPVQVVRNSRIPLTSLDIMI